jgi:hypothetical protein
VESRASGDIPPRRGLRQVGLSLDRAVSARGRHGHGPVDHAERDVGEAMGGQLGDRHEGRLGGVVSGREDAAGLT